MPEQWISGNRSMDSGRRPLCGCFVLSCRRDKVPARNTHRSSGFAFTLRKKFLRVPRGVFSKTRPCREWDRVPQWSVRLFFYFLDCTDSFVYNLVPSTLKRKSFFRSFTGLLFRTFCFPSRRTFGSSVA